MTSARPDKFIHLHVHSAYSLAEGAIRVKDLVKTCVTQGMPAVAVTDTNNLFGAMEFALEASKSGVQPIIGCQVRLGIEGQELVLLCQSEQGYRNLSRLISDAYMTSGDMGDPHMTWEGLAQFHEGLICLSGGLKGPVSQYLLHNQTKEAEAALKKLAGIYGDRLYIEIQRHDWPEENSIEAALIDLAYKHNVPLVATNDCYFAKREMHEAHDALLCIAEGRYIIEQDRRKVTPEHYFKSADEMIALFSDLPEAIMNTVTIARRCHFLLKPIKPILPPFTNSEGLSEVDELKRQSREGLEWRLTNFVFTPDMDDASREETAKPYRDRLEFELDTIVQMGFPGYFLIVSDFIKWAKDHDIPVGPGRGSGAGSVVAWSLKITDLDPLRFGLLFERFLNPERVSMPDFDVDFCQERRDEVIAYVQQRYGFDRVAQIITFGKLQARAVVRDVGRVLQMPYGQVDRIAKLIPNNPANPVTLEEALEQDADLRAARYADDTSTKLIDIALQLEGLYRHASTHAAGVVIGDRPLHELIPLYRDPRSPMPVTQFNMKYVEQAGLVKFDFLGLKTMTVVQKAVELVRQGGTDIDILQVPLDDAETYGLMAQGAAVGVFQLESSGMRDTLKKLKPNRFEDIIALVSLYRPGPMDNIPKYISVKEGQEDPDYMHPLLQPYLEETYGIMIYQEQVMQAAQALSGYTLGGADLLRRAMGKKIKEEMDNEREKFVKGAAETHNVGSEQSNYIFDQIAKFAGYGFNKSHAAAYALVSYWTGWLKANHPVEFMAASMTLDQGNTDKLAIFKQELDRMGIRLLGPDVNKSSVTFRVENGAIRYALAALKGVGEQAMQKVVEEREARGPYKDLQDFISRLDSKIMNRRQFEGLACAGAFDSLFPDRARLQAGSETVMRYMQTLTEERNSNQVSLFGGSTNTSLPPLELKTVESWDLLETLRHEFDAVGFYLSAHPLDQRSEQLSRNGVQTCATVNHRLENEPAVRAKMAGVLIKKQEKISKSGNKYAFLQLSDSSGVYEVTLFSETLAATRNLLEEGNQLLLSVDAETREDQIRMTAQRIELLESTLAAQTRTVFVYLSEPVPVSRIHDFMNIEGKGNIEIRLLTENKPGEMAECILPGRWSLSPQARSQIRKLAGVRQVREI